MKWRIGLPKADEKIHEKLAAGGWQPLKEPLSIGGVLLCSVPFLIISTLLSFLIIQLFAPLSLEEIGVKEGGLSVSISFSFIGGLVLLMTVHQLLHLLMVPHFWRSSLTWAGLHALGAFVYSEEKIPKRRLYFLLISPYFLLSVILPVMAGCFGKLNTDLKLLILINAAGSCTDLLMLFLVLFVPSGTIIRSSGHRSFWKFEQHP
ncbi:DUF3267 domain-containing protein [Bacillus sp. FJAT-42376]|uniref:DUF3267 domain-containing protein n=1 Tax=Bacillus sp. FJAT-42376 TaxID=2014076 RepID=UPI000F4F74F1|nr:DUF3267 domain-containing protein [Bacillus sp. FJAT-42376]AZB42724.1 DUF3267 domain-containing protein [Bacillus sp. FJAT-42376]